MSERRIEPLDDYDVVASSEGMAILVAPFPVAPGSSPELRVTASGEVFLLREAGSAHWLRGFPDRFRGELKKAGIAVVAEIDAGLAESALSGGGPVDRAAVREYEASIRIASPSCG